MPSPDKPVAQELGWKVISSHIPFVNKRLTIRDERLSIPAEQQPIAFAYVERAAGLIIVPVTARGEIVMIRQYRFPVDQWCLEIPAGSTGDTGEMPFEEVIRKELREEIGATAERIESVGRFFPAPAYATEVCQVFIAWGVELAERPEPEPTEKIQIEKVSVPEALRRAETGEIHNGACALAILLARGPLQAAGLL
ncbi:MAG: NUDIX hydrolase [Verrucomicrobiota bacterium]